ncbi:hypothetical protein GCM10010440_37230 [Kitasatospora cinereorecta]
MLGIAGRGGDLQLVADEDLRRAGGVTGVAGDIAVPVHACSRWERSLSEQGVTSLRPSMEPEARRNSIGTPRPDGRVVTFSYIAVIR